MTSLLPRASLLDLLSGSARLLGSRLDPDLPRGLLSPIEARVHMGIPYGDLLGEERERLRRGVSPSNLLAAAVGAALAPRGPAPRRPSIAGILVDNLSIPEAVDAIFAPAEHDGARVVHFVHPHAVNLAVTDEALRAALARADLTLPDGVGLRVAGLILGFSLRDNLNGTDLLPLLCARALRDGRPLALVGAAPGVAEDCARRLRSDFPGLSIPLIAHGFLDDAGFEAVRREVRALERPLVLVAMGSPLQEAWIWRYLADLPGVTALSVGGLFDFFSNRIPRAPWAWRELGLEWLFRLRCEPRRLARRYLVGNPAFLLRVARQRLLAAVPSLASSLLKQSS